MAVGQIVFRFDEYEIDIARYELRKSGQAVPVEPQVLATLILLASNSDRMVSRDEIVENVWHGRIVSESAISARIKAARQAIDDDGKRQALIKTIHGKGFRFVGSLERQMEHLANGIVGNASENPSPEHIRPTLAVLPFAFHGSSGELTFIGDAFAEEILIDLAKLSWLSVSGRGSSFRFRGTDADPVKVGKVLRTRYCVSGSATPVGSGIRFAIELAETSEGQVVWTDTFTVSLEEINTALGEIVAAVVSKIDHHIPLHEAKSVRGRPLFSLDTWSLYYLGYDSMLRFNRSDNDYAIKLLKRASELDENFSRAFAGLSFAHHQNYFMQYQSNLGEELEVARSLAQRALDLDRNDPFAHFNMGRSKWVDGGLLESIEWLEQATALSPSYAQGVYAKAWAQTLANEFEAGEENVREALRLSPLDPLRYAMLATMALSKLGQENFETASELAKRAARSPGAHKHIALIAAIAAAANGENEAAQVWLARANEMDGQIDAAMFLKSFPFAEGVLRERVEASLRSLQA